MNKPIKLIATLIIVGACLSVGAQDPTPDDRATKDDTNQSVLPWKPNSLLRLFVADQEEKSGLVKVQGFDKQSYFIDPSSEISGDILADANIIHLRGRQIVDRITLEFKPPAADKIKKLTKANQGRHLAIVVGTKVLSAPRINDTVSAKCVITGKFSDEDLQRIAVALGVADGTDGGTDPSQSVSQEAADVQVLFSGPPRMRVRWDVSGGNSFSPQALAVPGRQNLPQGAITRLKLTNIESYEWFEYYPTVELAAATPRTEEYLARNVVPIQFTLEDFRQVAAGKHVTKVIFCPDPVPQVLAQTTVETLVSTKLDSGVDPVVEADRRGTIVAIIRLNSKDVEALDKQPDYSEPTRGKSGFVDGGDIKFSWPAEGNSISGFSTKTGVWTKQDVHPPGIGATGVGTSVGAMHVRRYVQNQEETEADDDAALEIPRGYRVVSVKVNLGAFADIVRPGDLVDLLIAQSQEGNVGERKSVRLLLEKVKVFAVDHNLQQKDLLESSKTRTISLLVTSAQTETVLEAKNTGQFHLALCQMEDQDDDVKHAQESVTDSAKSAEAKNRGTMVQDFYAFSGTKGRWDVLRLKSSRAFHPEIADDHVIVRDGDAIYTFSAVSGRWTSPNQTIRSQTDPRNVFRQVTELEKVAQLKSQLSQFEQNVWKRVQAARDNGDARLDLGEEVRPQLRQELEEKVNEAFELQQKVHEAELAVLELRLKNARQKLAQRAATKKQIVNRRIQYLLQADVPRNTFPPLPTSRVATPGNSQVANAAIEDRLPATAEALSGRWRVRQMSTASKNEDIRDADAMIDSESIYLRLPSQEESDFHMAYKIRAAGMLDITVIDETDRGEFIGKYKLVGTRLYLALNATKDSPVRPIDVMGKFKQKDVLYIVLERWSDADAVDLNRDPVAPDGGATPTLPNNTPLNSGAPVERESVTDPLSF